MAAVKLVGNALARAIKAARKAILKVKGQNPTPDRIKRLAKYENNLDNLLKQTASGKVAPKATAKAEWKRPPGTAAKTRVKKEAREQKARTPKEQAERERRTATQEEKRRRAKGAACPYTRRPLHAPLRALGTKLSRKEIKQLTPEEEIEYLLNRAAPPATRAQAAEAMGIKKLAYSREDIDEGFQVLKKGGLSRKKYQSTKKYGGKEYVYMGGGIVGDIAHFKKKRS